MLPSKMKTLNANKLFVDFEINPREKNRYKLDVLLMQIVAFGRIMTPIVVEEREPDAQHKDVWHLVLQGNRRALIAQMCQNEPQKVTNALLAIADSEVDVTKAKHIREHLVERTKEIVDSFSKLECTVHKGLTSNERDSIIMDHGSQLDQCRTEIVRTVWRKLKAGASQIEIINSMYFGF